MSNKPPCPKCDGIGIVKTSTGSRDCDCQIEERALIRLRNAQIPERYLKATLAGFEMRPHTRIAFTAAQGFIREFMPGSKETVGFIFTGSTGTGKTHLSCAILRELIETKGIHGLFVDYRGILDRLRRTFDDDARETWSEIMDPLLGADLVVIDDLGAQQATLWVYDIVELLIGTLYNRKTPLIVTTNFPMQGKIFSLENRKSGRVDSLSERIGERMFSRIQEMCRTIDISGPDFRSKTVNES